MNECKRVHGDGCHWRQVSAASASGQVNALRFIENTGGQARQWHPTFLLIVAGALLHVAVCGQRAFGDDSSAESRTMGLTPLDKSAADETFKRLKAIWEGQQTDIVTARLSYRLVQLPGIVRPGVTPSSFHAFLETFHPDEKPDDLRKLASEFAIGLPDLKLHPWFDKTFLFDGRRRLESSGRLTTLTDGEMSISSLQHSRNRQIDVRHARGGSRRVPDLSSFRFVPSPHAAASVLEGRLKPMRVDAHPNEILLQSRAAPKPGVTNAAIVEMIIDKETGACERFTVRRGQAILSEILQSDFHNYADGILFPRFRIATSYADGTLIGIKCNVITDAAFNERLDNDAFRVGATKGDTLVDHTMPSKDRPVTVSRVPRDVSDVTALPKLRIPANLSVEPDRPRSHLAFLVVLNIALVGVLIGFLSGRVSLHATPEAEPYYERLNSIRGGTLFHPPVKSIPGFHPGNENLPLWELTQEGADKLLEDYHDG